MFIIFVVVLYLDFCVRDLVKCAFKEGEFACREFFFQFILWWYAMERMCLRIFAWMNDVVSVLSYGKIAKRSSMYRCARKYVVVGFVRVIML